MLSSGTEDPARAASADLEKQQSVKITGPAANSHSRPGRGRGFAGLADLFLLDAQDSQAYGPASGKRPNWYQRLVDAGFEDNGIQPVPLDQRTNTQYSNLFTLFFTSMMSLLPLPTGILGTYTFGLSLRNTSLIILFFGILTIFPPAFLGISGSQTGMRQMILARYSFGLILVTIPLLLNAATVTGFTLLSSVVGGQAISALNPDHVSVKVGIVIVCLVSLFASLMGYRSLHMLERWSWIPNLISLIIAVGCGGKYLHLQAEAPPATARQVLSYGGIIAGYFLTFSGTVSDYATYHNPRASKLKIFLYIYLGILTPSIPLLVLGAAIGGAIPNVPSWLAAYNVSSVGGVIYEMLTPAGGFGKFVVVMLALSSIGNIAISSYSVSLNMQMMLPFFARIHRIVFVVITLAIMIPCAIKAAESWEESLSNFLAVIGYWAGCFAAVLMEELVLIRRMDYSTYDISIWNVRKKLPLGLAAIVASLLSFAVVIPGMDEAWYVGPIAKHSGDIGFEVAFAITAIFYWPLRRFEIKWQGHL